MSDQQVTLQHPGGTLELPVVPATEGESAIDVSKLLSSTGFITLDPGFVNTAATTSSITYIDGDAGVLRYRGYPIEQLAAQSTFLEVSYLLIYGELPTAAQLEDFTNRISRHTLLHEDLKRFFDGFPRDAHPMPVLSSRRVGAVDLLPGQPEHPRPRADRALDDPAAGEAADDRRLCLQEECRAALPLPRQQPRAGRELPADDVRVPGRAVRRRPGDVRVPSTCCSSCTRTTSRTARRPRCAWSARARPTCSRPCPPVSTRSPGPLHGGANSAVLEMLEQIRNSDDDVDTFVRKVKNKEGGVRLMGFGHRVYKNYDPRAAIIKKTADEILGNLGRRDELLDIALRLEEIALNDDYFVERKLYPNVDFYTGLIYKAMGFPTRMFTVLFALGRLPGWIAQWREMMEDPATKIGRPRQVYTGRRGARLRGDGPALTPARVSRPGRRRTPPARCPRRPSSPRRPASAPTACRRSRR